MSGTDAYVDGATAPSLDLEVRKEIQRLRKLLLFPNDVHLISRVHTSEGDADERWLSDRYIMVNVTGSSTLKAPPDPAFGDLGADWADGGYKLTAGKGLVEKPDTFLPDTVGLLDSIERAGTYRDANGEIAGAVWQRMHRTQWSMADSEAKLMLAYTKEMNDDRSLWVVEPYAVNEEIWVAFENAFAYPGDTEVVFEVCEDRPYRVSLKGRVVGYIARAEFPDDAMREDALRVAEAVSH